MNKNIKLFTSFALVGIIVPFTAAIFCKTLEIGDEISVAIITAISTIIVVVIETLPKIIKVKKDDSERKISHIETKMEEIEVNEDVIVGNRVIGETSSNSSSKKVEYKKTELKKVKAGGSVVAGDDISKG